MTRRYLSARLSGPRWLGAAALALGLVLLVALAVQASLPNGTPARPVSQALWGELEPTDPAGQPLPDGRDNTSFNEFQTSYWLAPWWMSIDIEAGRIFTIGSQTLQIWDATGDPANPRLLGGAARSAIIQRVTGEDATGWPMRDIDLPPNNTQVAAVVGAVLGVTIWDTRNPSSPSNVYQLPGEGHEVHATTIGGRHYAFVASGDGLLVFDMSQALQGTRCLDNTAGTACSGVFRGHLGAVRGLDYIDGTGAFLAGSAGDGVEIWNVAGAPAGQLVVHALEGLPTRGVALWRDVDSSAYYLAVVVSRFIAGQGLVYEGRIYDMSCLNSGGCQDAGPLLTTINLGRNHGIRSFVTFSRSGPNAFLYFGTDNRTGGGPQREFLVDVTNPDNPSQTRDITPQGTIVSDGKTVDYWSWYYEGNNGPNDLQGFNGVGPRRGKFLGEYFYRAAWSIFDVHRRTAGLPPAAEFDWVSHEADPEKIYPGSLVDFFDRSTGQPSGWSWFFQNGSPLTSPLRNPQVVFDVTGPFPTTTTVSLTSFNDAGESDPMTKELTLLNPAPSVAGVSSNVNLATVCQPITFEAQDVSGKSPLVFSWEVLDTDNNDLTVTGPTTPDTDPSRFVWDTTPFQTLDGDRSFKAQVTVTGTGDPAVGFSPEVVLRPLAPLPAAGSFEPTHDPFVTGEVQFHVSVLGATEWLWDFGDGTVGEWTSDPVDGPNPVHVYEEIGTFEVTVQVRNCTNPDNPITSAPLEVDIVTIEVLHAEFEAVTGPGGVTCFPDIGGCKWFAKPGDEIAFEDRSTGAQEYHYDWDGNGSFEDGPHTTPRLSHKYFQEGVYTPVLKVVGLGDEEVFVHPFEINVEGGGSNPPPPPPPPPSAKIFVSGPITGTPGTAYQFRATTTGCTPAAAGWSWEVSRGGQISGVPSSSTINVSWPSTGRKTVAARNSGCGSAVGSTAITLTDSTTPPPPPPPPDNGGDLEASFTFSPQNPAPGQTVIFNGSASTGDPTTYTWSFGDGQRQDTATPSVQHVYSAPGSYQVALAVSRPGTCTNFGICSSHDTKKTIVVSGTPVDPEPEPEPEEPLTVCPDDPDALCFLDGRFKVSVTWSDPARSGDSGIGKPLAEDPLPDQDTTGFFWFFNPNSVDLIVKFLDGAPNGAVWFFSGGLSDAEYTIRVEDRASEPHTVKTYENIAGNICGLADTEAFPQVASLPGGQTVVLTGHSLDGGTRNVSGAGASGLHADFTFTPQNPAPGQPVVFNASASTGDPDTYTWVFGDGGRPVSTSGPSVQHVYSEPGTYEVRLAVSRPGSCTNFGICSSPDTKKSIVVSGEPFDPGPGDDPGGDDSGGDDPGGDDSGGDDPGGDDGGETVTGDTTACEPGPETLCLLDGRFEIRVDWRNPRPPFNSGTGRAIEGTQESGYFWFFSPTNVELVLKMIDGHGVNDHFWVFFGALTDVEYDIAVRDTETGLTETYTNAAGNICGQADTQAFE